MKTALAQRCAVGAGAVSAGAIAWEFKGELRVTAIVKATFAYSASGAVGRAAPRPLQLEDEHHARNRLRSVLVPSDLVPYKKRADFLFTGQAHAPGGAPAASMNVRIALGSGARTLVDKTLVVRKPGGFQRLHLLYEHAVGGPGDDANPFGEEPDDDPEDPSSEVHILDPRAPERPAGFGPVARNMLPRKALLGGLPLPSFGSEPVPLPASLPFEVFQSAPADQQTELLRGDEQIVLEGLHPESPRLVLRLPGARAAARVHGLTGPVSEGARPLAMYADTVHILGDEGLIVVTWRGTFAVPTGEILGRILIAAGVETPTEPIPWPDPAQMQAAATLIEVATSSARPPESNATLPLSDEDLEVVSSSGLPRSWPGEGGPGSTPRTAAETLALVTAAAQSSPVVRVSPPQPKSAPKPDAGNETLPVASRVARAAAGPALPFQPAAPGATPAIPDPPRPPPPPGGETLPLPTFKNRSEGSALPFGSGARPAAISPAQALSPNSPAGQAPSQQALTGQAPSQQAPTGQAPTGQAPTGQASSPAEPASPPASPAAEEPAPEVEAAAPSGMEANAATPAPPAP
ncbi:MAG: DUF2169 domain-containing protein, partial [Polyangiaceae bacterium]